MKDYHTKKFIGFRLDSKHILMLKRAAKTRQRGQSELIREAIEALYAN